MVAHPQDSPQVAQARHTFSVFGTAIDALTPAQALQRIAHWARKGDSRYVCICNAHSAVTAHQDAQFRQALAQADMATPDGAPLAWMGRRLGWPAQQRVCGPDLMLDYCAHAAQVGEPIYLYGSQATTLAKLQAKLQARWPTLRIAGSHSPPFRPLSPVETQQVVKAINASGAKTVWVSLGCPKQELWMAAQRGQINAVMVGVGAAFDFHAGVLARAPRWMQRLGLEWLFRLISEPRRLWRRYAVTNTRFILLAIRQLLRG